MVEVFRGELTEAAIVRGILGSAGIPHEATEPTGVYPAGPLRQVIIRVSPGQEDRARELIGKRDGADVVGGDRRWRQRIVLRVLASGLLLVILIGILESCDVSLGIP
jgi:hypothetical protein